MACWPTELVVALHKVTGAADFRTPGLPAIGPGGKHARFQGLPEETIILTPDDARRHVAARVAEGVDYIKASRRPPAKAAPPRRR